MVLIFLEHLPTRRAVRLRGLHLAIPQQQDRCHLDVNQQALRCPGQVCRQTCWKNTARSPDALQLLDPPANTRGPVKQAVQVRVGVAGQVTGWTWIWSRHLRPNRQSLRTQGPAWDQDRHLDQEVAGG